MKTPKSLRLHIGLFGRSNTGKSSLLNAVTRQNVSIVSPVAGTTTDPVEKPMEMLPLGPVVFIDTAGVDDVGALGPQRIARTRKAFDRTDVGVIVTDRGEWGEFEEGIREELAGRGIPVIAAFNKADLEGPDAATLARLESLGVSAIRTVASRGEGVEDLRERLIAAAPEEVVNTPTLLGDLVPPGRLAVLVVPIDKEAPKGRLILPQVQAIRDLLDHDAMCMVVKERDLSRALDMLKEPPALVVTDSQAFAEVAEQTPPGVPLTSFSILFSRAKGDLEEFARGAAAIAGLRPGDRVLVAESCSHHPIGDDIGRVKVPRWLNARAGGELRFTTCQGQDFPADLGSYSLVVHCGSCMLNRRTMLSRVSACRRAGVPVTNYGMAIAFCLGVLDRSLEVFPSAMEE